MAPYVPVQRSVLHQQPLSAEGDVGEYSEQVLRLMHSLGIDQHKTVEVRAPGKETRVVAKTTAEDKGGAKGTAFDAHLMVAPRL